MIQPVTGVTMSTWCELDADLLVTNYLGGFAEYHNSFTYILRDTHTPCPSVSASMEEIFPGVKVTNCEVDPGQGMKACTVGLAKPCESY